MAQPRKVKSKYEDNFMIQGLVFQCIVSLVRSLRGSLVNLPVTNGISHPYHLGESTSIFRGNRSDFSFLFHFSMKFM